MEKLRRNILLKWGFIYTGITILSMLAMETSYYVFTIHDVEP